MWTYKEWYWKNVDSQRIRARDRMRERQAFIHRIKEETPCMDCGLNWPAYVMQFDHRPDEIKLDSVSNLLGRKMEIILAEIKKCDLVCGNCHAIRTSNRRGPLA